MMENGTPRHTRDVAMYNAGQALNGRGNRLGLIVCLLACVLATVAVVFLVTAVEVALDLTAQMGTGEALLFFNLVQMVMCFFLVYPLYLGTFRLALSMSRGETVDFSTVFDFYTSPVSLFRAWGIQLHVLLRGLPILVAFLLPSLLPNLLIPNNDDSFLVLQILILVVAEPLLLFWGGFMTSRIFPFVMLVLDEPEMPLLEGIRLAKQMTSGRMLSVFAMRGRLLWRFLLSLLTVGVVTALHVLPLTLLAYSEYSHSLAEDGKASDNIVL